MVTFSTFDTNQLLFLLYKPLLCQQPPILVYGTHCFWVIWCWTDFSSSLRSLSKSPTSLVVVYEPTWYCCFQAHCVRFQTTCFFDTNQLFFCASHTCFSWCWYKSFTKYLFKHLFLKFFRVVTATLGVARGDYAYVQKHWRAFSPQQAGVQIEFSLSSNTPLRGVWKTKYFSMDFSSLNLILVP